MIVKEDLPGKAGNSLPVLMSADAVKLQEYRTPKQVDSQASLLKKGHKWLISASGGVSIQSWAVVDRAEKSDAPAACLRQDHPRGSRQVVLELTPPLPPRDGRGEGGIPSGHP